MRSLLVVFLGAVLLAGTSFAQEMEANDIEETVPMSEVLEYLGGDVDGGDEIKEIIEKDHPIVPQARVTCDLLSYWGVGHTACAAHCIAKGFKGGWCDSKMVCNCRR